MFLNTLGPQFPLYVGCRKSTLKRGLRMVGAWQDLPRTGRLDRIYNIADAGPPETTQSSQCGTAVR